MAKKSKKKTKGRAAKKCAQCTQWTQRDIYSLVFGLAGWLGLDLETVVEVVQLLVTR